MILLFLFNFLPQKVESTIVSPLDIQHVIDISNFGEKFDLFQLHFHWGRNDYQGSEHQINDKKFPLEVLQVKLKFRFIYDAKDLKQFSCILFITLHLQEQKPYWHFFFK